MFEDFEQERYEEPDYNVWETDRVYEDMAIEREEAEAEAEAERLETIVAGAVAYRDYDPDPPIWSDVVRDIVQALNEAGVTFGD